jgi:hypothetical protein
MAIQQLGLIKSRAQKRIDAAKRFTKQVFPTLPENQQYLENALNEANDLKKSKKELKSAHKEWQQQIEDETDSTKKESEQRKLNAELSKPEGILAYIDDIDEVLETLDGICLDLAKHLRSFNNSQMTTLDQKTADHVVPQPDNQTTVSPSPQPPVPPQPADTSSSTQQPVQKSVSSNDQVNQVPPYYQYPSSSTLPYSTPAPNYYPQYSSLSMSLPKLEMPKFSGDPKTFKFFWNTFRIVIHDNPSLSKYDKLAHLLNCLTGTAKQMFQLYSTSPRLLKL